MISVIIPIYNVEKYLNACVESVLAQTYTDLEILLVDDGSIDHCSEMVDQWARRDSRIKAIHRTNGGLSAARNTGMNAATGDYIYFLDSDDMIEPMTLEYLIGAIESTGSDAAFCGVNEHITEDMMQPTGQVVSPGEVQVYSGREIIKGSYDEPFGVTGIFAWNKLYRTTDTWYVRFPEGRIREDEYTTHQFLWPLEKVVYVPAKLCCYRQRSGSIMNAAGDVKQIDLMDAYLAQVRFFRDKKDKELYTMRTSQVAEGLLYNIEEARKNGRDHLVRLWTRMLREFYESDYRRVKVAPRSRIRMWAYISAPAVYRIIWGRK